VIERQAQPILRNIFTVCISIKEPKVVFSKLLIAEFWRRFQN